MDSHIQTNDFLAGKDDFYNIACGVDDKFVMPLATMLNSLFIFNKHHRFRVFILSLKISNENKKQISDWVHSKEHIVKFIDVEEQLLNPFPIMQAEDISKATYLRIFIPELIPQEINKILYLDTDIIINRNIDNLYNTNIDSYALAAVEDAPNDSFVAKKNFPSRYFNAGVLLLNLQFLREINFSNQARQYIQQSAIPLKFHDQDILNDILLNKILFLPIQWNLLDCFFYKPAIIQNERINELTIAKRSPAIIHFSGTVKPWHVGNIHPLSKKFKSCRPKLKIYNEVSKWEKFKTFPRYQKILFIMHCPTGIIRIIDPIIIKIWTKIDKLRQR